MDQVIKSYEGYRDDDLFITKDIAYQYDMSNVIDYGSEYFEKVKEKSLSDIALKLNMARFNLVKKYTNIDITDVGIGDGSFVSYADCYGYDINPLAVEWLKKRNKFSINFFKAVTFWDSLEHIPDPSIYLERAEYIFISIPIFDDLEKIRESKHYRPGEHLYYFTDKGLIKWMAEYDFKYLERNDIETQLGRESIKSYAFEWNRRWTR